MLQWNAEMLKCFRTRLVLCLLIFVYYAPWQNSVSKKLCLYPPCFWRKPRHVSQIFGIYSYVCSGTSKCFLATLSLLQVLHYIKLHTTHTHTYEYIWKTVKLHVCIWLLYSTHMWNYHMYVHEPDEHTFVKGYIHETYGNTSRRWTFIVYFVCVTLVDTLSVEVIKVN